MKEKIYTIPVTEAFGEDCECPLCLLESKLEKEYIEYYLGPSLMEPDCRIDTNKKGFCRRHYELLYNRQENRLGLGLITDTHIREQLGKLKDAAKPLLAGSGGDKGAGFSFGSLVAKLGSKNQADPGPASKLLKLLLELENSCTICGRLEYTMDRYLDVIMYLWSRESDFRKTFSEKKGFCLVHLRMLIQAAEKYLNAGNRKAFLRILMEQQLDHMDRIEKELEWFTKKFDYRYNDAPWGNSKDALPRSIQKLKGFCSLK
ncbi:MAG: ABC transporter substrate-binding protein [Clostridiaceae bacterium]|jgi:hypothetical protein|nr:ABC transporter substrate-binding protein [Clostridiaceae bacterium]